MNMISIVPDVMLVDTETQSIDIRQIDNRRFMYNPKTKMLVLGRQNAKAKQLSGSHAVELADAGITSGFDDFVRGWIGTGRSYPYGIIHFAPNVDERNVSLFERSFDTLEMFGKNGAVHKTVIRGFGSRWEQPLGDIIDVPSKEVSSIRDKLKTNRTIKGDITTDIKTITTDDLRRMEERERDLLL